MTVYAIRTRLAPDGIGSGEWWFVKRADGASFTRINSRAFSTPNIETAKTVRDQLAAKLPLSEFEVVDLWAKDARA